MKAPILYPIKMVRMKRLIEGEYDHAALVRGMKKTEAGREHLASLLAANEALELADGACYRMPLSKYKQYLKDGEE